MKSKLLVVLQPFLISFFDIFIVFVVKCKHASFDKLSMIEDVFCDEDCSFGTSSLSESCAAPLWRRKFPFLSLCSSGISNSPSKPARSYLRILFDRSVTFNQSFLFVLARPLNTLRTSLYTPLPWARCWLGLLLELLLEFCSRHFLDCSLEASLKFLSE